LRSFDPAVSIRIESSGEAAQLIAIEMADNFEGSGTRRIEKRLAQAELEALARQVQELNFWQLPTRKAVNGLDGAHWILEISDPDRYHVVDRWGGDEIKSVGLWMLEESELNIETIH